MDTRCAGRIPGFAGASWRMLSGYSMSSRHKTERNVAASRADQFTEIDAGDR